MKKCKICRFKFKNDLSASRHIKMKHNMSILQYAIKYDGFKIPKCEICNNDAKYYNGLTFRKTCGSDICKSKLLKNNKHTEKLKEKYLENVKIF